MLNDKRLKFTPILILLMVCGMFFTLSSISGLNKFVNLITLSCPGIYAAG